MAFGLSAAITVAAGYYLLSMSPDVLDRSESPTAVAVARQAVTQSAVRVIVHTIGYSLHAAAGQKYT